MSQISNQVNDKNYSVIDKRTQQSPAIALGRKNYLVVWECWNEDKIYGQLLDTTKGKTIGNNFVISTKSGEEWVCSDPDVAFNASPEVEEPTGEYLVVWDETNWLTGTETIQGQFVDSSGKKKFSSSFTISSGSMSGPHVGQAVVAFDGNNFLVVWKEDYAPNWDSDIKGQFLDQNGNPVGNSFVICSNVKKAYLPAVSFGGNCYLVAWQEEYTIYGRVVKKNGSLSPKVRIGDNGEIYQFAPSIASNGTNFLVVWEDRRETTSSQVKSDIYGQFVDMQGALTGKGNFPICKEQGSQINPAVAHPLSFVSSKTHYKVVWADNRNGNWDIYRRTVDFTGKLLWNEEAVNPVKYDQNQPDVAQGSGIPTVIVWRDNRGGDWDIYGTAILSGCLIATAAYGSPFSPEVHFLRTVRDKCFKQRRWGKEVVDMFEKFYYKFSPQVAQIMAHNKNFKNVIRWTIAAPIIRLLRLYIFLNKYLNPNLLKDMASQQISKQKNNSNQTTS